MLSRLTSLYDRVAAAAAAAVALHGLTVLFGWWAGWSVFVSPPASFIPMAPSTALAFLLLGAALFVRVVWAGRAQVLGATALVAWTVAAAALLNVVVPAGLDRFLGGGTGQFGAVRLGVMSPVTAAALLPLAIAVALVGPRNRIASACALLPAAIGVTVAMGYAYGSPLLYGSGTIPVALPTGISLLLLGSAAIVAAGPEVWPVQLFVGESPRARMLRAFLPATVGITMVMGLLDARFGALLGAGRVLLSAWLGVLGVGVMTVLVWRLARRIGADLERADADRHRAERRYREMFEQALVGVATTTLDGRIALCNAAFARMFGYESPEALVGQPAMQLYWDAGDREPLLAQLREHGALVNFEQRMRRKDGAPVWVLANITLHQDASGDARIENTVLDITERKGLEQQLWQAQKLDALGSLAGGVAHDFNNLLTAIVGYAELMHDDLAPDDPRREDLEEIDRACGRAAALTRQLLAFSRRQPFEPKALRLDESVREMEKMLGRLLGPAVRLVTAENKDLPLVWADPSQIEQVVLNLAVNARDAMPGGGTLTIETRTEVFDERYTAEQVDLAPGAYVQLAVSDTGTGMDKDTVARVFEPFFTTKEKGKGTGLGLATVYGIVKQSRGHILVYSELGVGTTFKCFFPVTDAAVSRAAVAAIPERIGGQETILVVEDEAPILKLAVATLERHGYRVLAAADGETAMRIAAEHDGVIDLLLSDGVLSGMRVPELLRRVRSGRPQTKILLMSGYSQEAVFQNEIVAPQTAFLAKPFTARQLTARVREVLDTPPGV